MPCSSGGPLEVTPEVVDGELPAGALIGDPALNQRDRRWLRSRLGVLDRPEGRRDPRELAPRQQVSAFNLGMGPRFKRAAQFERIALAHERDAVAVIAAATGPLAIYRKVVRVDAR